MTFLEIQQEVARRAFRNNATQFTQAIKNAINGSLFRICREAYWRNLRRRQTFNTVASYTTGSGAVTATLNSANITVTGATFITDGVQPGRLISISGSNKTFEIKYITGETTLTLDQVYDGSSITDGTYEIFPQEEYNLPIQVTHRCFLWHEDYGYPYRLNFIQDQEFFGFGMDRSETGTPTHYRMWGSDSVIEQLKQASVVTAVSSSAADTTGSVTVYGIVSGYPDQETISISGTTPVAGSKSFTTVERVVRNFASTGRITLTGNAGTTTVCVFPTGDGTEGIIYRKVQLYPLPESVFPIHVFYYKDVYALVNDSDVHELGPDFDEAIICLSCSKLQLETGQTEGTNFYQLYKDEIKSLRSTNTDKFDYFSVLKRGGSSGKYDPLITPNLSYRQAGLSPVVR